MIRTRFVFSYPHRWWLAVVLRVRAVCGAFWCYFRTVEDSAIGGGGGVVAETVFIIRSCGRRDVVGVAPRCVSTAEGRAERMLPTFDIITTDSAREPRDYKDNITGTAIASRRSFGRKFYLYTERKCSLARGFVRVCVCDPNLFLSLTLSSEPSRNGIDFCFVFFFSPLRARRCRSRTWSDDKILKTRTRRPSRDKRPFVERWARGVRLALFGSVPKSRTWRDGKRKKKTASNLNRRTVLGISRTRRQIFFNNKSGYRGYF